MRVTCVSSRPWWDSTFGHVHLLQVAPGSHEIGRYPLPVNPVLRLKADQILLPAGGGLFLRMARRPTRFATRFGSRNRKSSMTWVSPGAAQRRRYRWTTARSTPHPHLLQLLLRRSTASMDRRWHRARESSTAHPPGETDFAQSERSSSPRVLCACLLFWFFS